MCREQVAQLRDALPRIEALGAGLVIIGNGSPEAARTFAEQHAGGLAVYTDPSRESYRAAGFTRSLKATFSPRMIASALRARRGGARQGRLQGDPLQQGGVLVIGPGGELLHRHASRFGGDHQEVEEVLEALSGSSPASS